MQTRTFTLIGLFLTLFFAGNGIAQSRQKPATATLLSLKQDSDEGSVFFDFKPYQALGLNITCKTELFAGASSASAVAIEGAVNEKTFQKVNSAYNSFPIRIPHPYLLSAKLKGKMTAPQSVIGKLTLKVVGAADTVIWTPSFKYTFAKRDRDSRFTAWKCDPEASSELYKVDDGLLGRQRFLFVADLDDKAKALLQTGPSSTADIIKTKTLAWHWEQGSTSFQQIRAMINTSFFSVIADPNETYDDGYSVDAQVNHGLRVGGTWWNPNNPQTIMRGMSFFEWGLTVDTATGVGATEQAKKLDAKSKIIQLGGQNIVVGMRGSAQIDTTNTPTAQTFIGSSKLVNGKATTLYILSVDGAPYSFSSLSPANANKAIIAAGALESSVIWLDGGGSTHLQTRFDGVTELNTNASTRAIPATLIIGKR